MTMTEFNEPEHQNHHNDKRNSTISQNGNTAPGTDENGGIEPERPSEKAMERRLTAFERLSMDLSNDQRVLKEITLGKRIGFYRIRGELGSGNFSQVKMGIHALTKGKHFCLL